MAPDVLLIAAGWKVRALIRSQLLEDGFEVHATGASEEAELLLQRRAIRPRLILLDAIDEAHPGAAIATFRRLAPDVPLVVLAGAATLNAGERALVDPANLLQRPFRIQDAVGLVAERLGRSPGGAR